MNRHCSISDITSLRAFRFIGFMKSKCPQVEYIGAGVRGGFIVELNERVVFSDTIKCSNWRYGIYGRLHNF